MAVVVVLTTCLAWLQPAEFEDFIRRQKALPLNDDVRFYLWAARLMPVAFLLFEVVWWFIGVK